MALFKIEAWKCEWCGKSFDSIMPMHEIDCRYGPQARTCDSCLFNKNVASSNRDNEAIRYNITYCERVNSVFKYPHDKYCPKWERNPNYMSLQQEVKLDG